MNEIINMEDIKYIEVLFNKYMNELNGLFNNLIEVLKCDEKNAEDKYFLIREIKDLMVINSDVSKILSNKVLDNYVDLDEKIINVFNDEWKSN
ncbi:MAG: hypothetical protein ACI4WW_07635 [Candidatus Coprovivens sp.]